MPPTTLNSEEPVYRVRILYFLAVFETIDNDAMAFFVGSLLEEV